MAYNAEIIARKFVGKTRIKTSRKEVSLPTTGVVPWVTAIDCAKRGSFFIDLDCRPSEWRCGNCPRGAACGGGSDFLGGMCTFGAPFAKESTEMCKVSPKMYKNNDYNDNGIELEGVPLIWDEEACLQCNFTALQKDTTSDQTTEEKLTTSYGQWFGGNERHLWTRSRSGYWKDMEAWRIKMALGIVNGAHNEKIQCEDKNMKWIQIKQIINKTALSRMSKTAIQSGSFDSERYICSNPKNIRKFVSIESFRECVETNLCPGGPGGKACRNTTVAYSRLCEICENGYSMIGNECMSCDVTAGDSLIMIVGIIGCIVVVLVVVLVLKLLRIRKKKKHGNGKTKSQLELQKEAMENASPRVLDENTHAVYSQEHTGDMQKEMHDTDMLIYHKYNQPIGVKLKIVIAYAQVVTVFGQLLPIKYLLEQDEMNQKTDVMVNFDLSSITWFNCQMRFNFLNHLVFNTLALEISGFVLPFLVYIIAKIVLSTKKDTKHAKDLLKSIKEKMVHVAITIILVLYPTASKKIVRFFDCDSEFDDGRVFLRADYSIECNQSTWNSMWGYAFFSSLLIPMGIPIILCIVLYRQNQAGNLFNYVIKKGHTAKQVRRIGPEFPVPDPIAAGLYGALYIGYEDEMYLWEVWDMFRRLFLTSAWTLISPDNQELQMALLLLFLTLCIMIQGYLSPYISTSADQLAVVLQFCLFVSVFGGVALLITSDSDSADSYLQNENLILWKSICFGSIVAGYVIGGCSILWELYFGQLFAERTVYNDGLCPEEQMTMRQWFTFYNKRLKERVKLALHVSTKNSNSKITPIADVETEQEIENKKKENNRTRTWSEDGAGDVVNK